MPTKSKIRTQSKRSLPLRQIEKTVQSDYNKIYKRKNFFVGWPKENKRIFEHITRKNTAAIVGAALGDEGKGRFIDNTIATFLQKKNVKRIYVIRFQGGNNAGHTIEKGKIKLAMHVIPSGVFCKQAISIMDRGMIIHPEDLQTEITYVEKAVGSIKNRLFLSNDAIFCSDLERAEEQLNRIKEGKSKGGTGRGMAPSYAHHYDKTGMRICDLMDDDWQEKLEKRYQRYEKEFAVYNLQLKEVMVPDFFTIKKTGKAAERPVGDIKTFIKRLKIVRAWLIERKMVRNTFYIHQEIAADPNIAVVFEGAQGAGLDAWLGTRPDVTESNTSVYGLREGTGFWRMQDIANRIGVIKVPYTSSVGARRMPTHIDLPKNLADLPADATDDQRWAAYIREEAHEYGTTTGRPRDINFLDLEFIAYNARMSGIETIAVTHADLSRETDMIKVCTHYTDQKGNYLPYQPGLHFIKEAVPHYVTLPGWDGTLCRKAKTARSLPENCLKFLSFIQTRTGMPIVAAGTGPDRKSFIAFPGFLV